MRKLRGCLFLVLLLALVSTGWADQVKLKSGLPYNGKVMNYRDYTITITLSTGRSTERPIGDVGTITLDGQKAFNDAEMALAAKKYDDAIKLYDRAERTAATDWLKQLINDRRYTALAASGEIDRALQQWLAMADENGLTKSVLALQPKTFGAEGSTTNKRAIDLLAKKAAELKGKDKDQYLRAVLNMKMEIQRANGDVEAAAETAMELSNVGRPAQPSGDGGPAIAPPPPPTSSALNAMRTLFEAGQYDRVIDQVSKSLLRFDEQDLSEALTLLGRAQLAAYKNQGDSADRKLLIDAGKHLMLVYAEFASSPEAAEALYHAALVNQELGEQAAVRATLEEIVKSYPDTPWAERARAALGGEK